MTKRIIAASSLLSLMLSASPVLATPNFVPASLSTPGTERTLALPTQAGNSSVISLGESVDPTTGKVVEGLAFVHYGSTGSLQGKKGFEHKGKPHGKGKGGGDTGSVCYSFLANGTKWNVTENYIFDPTNSRGLDGVVLSGLLATSIESWDGEVSADVFGTEVVGVIDAASIGNSTNGQNEVIFADVDSAGAIAVTIVWGIFRGPPSGRELVEWDMVFDDTDYDWSAEVAGGVAGKMDFHNIAVHEVGHAAGMGHSPDSCADETMYSYADFEEITKRDLNAGDIAGIVDLYN